MQHILITGGTCTLGRLVVPQLRDAGCKVRVLSRRSREAGEDIEFVAGDLDTGEGIGEAVEGSSPIVQLLSCEPFLECPPDTRLTALVTKRSILDEENSPRSTSNEGRSGARNCSHVRRPRPIWFSRPTILRSTAGR